MQLTQWTQLIENNRQAQVRLIVGHVGWGVFHNLQSPNQTNRWGQLDDSWIKEVLKKYKGQKHELVMMLSGLENIEESPLDKLTPEQWALFKERFEQLIVSHSSPSQEWFIKNIKNKVFPLSMPSLLRTRERWSKWGGSPEVIEALNQWIEIANIQGSRFEEFHNQLSLSAWHDLFIKEPKERWIQPKNSMLDNKKVNKEECFEHWLEADVSEIRKLSNEHANAQPDPKTCNLELVEKWLWLWGLMEQKGWEELEVWLAHRNNFQWNHLDLASRPDWVQLIHWMNQFKDELSQLKLVDAPQKTVLDHINEVRQRIEECGNQPLWVQLNHKGIISHIKKISVNQKGKTNFKTCWNDHEEVNKGFFVYWRDGTRRLWDVWLHQPHREAWLSLKDSNGISLLDHWRNNLSTERVDRDLAAQRAKELESRLSSVDEAPANSIKKSSRL